MDRLARDGGSSKIIPRLIKFPLRALLLQLKYKMSVDIFDALMHMERYYIVKWVFPFLFCASYNAVTIHVNPQCSMLSSPNAVLHCSLSQFFNLRRSNQLHSG